MFARNRVVIVPAGIGVRGAHTRDGRITAATCYGELVTLDPTGVALESLSAHATLAKLFDAWGLPLSDTQVAGFTAPPGTTVRCYVDGRRIPGPPARIPITPHAEIVLEVGPFVPPHSSYTFPRESAPRSGSQKGHRSG